MVEAILIIVAVLVVLGLIAAGRSVRVVQQFEQGIVFRFGRIQSPPRGAGLTMIRPVGDRMQKVNMQIIAMAVPAQEGITRDNVTVRVDAVVYFRVVDPIKATVNVQNYLFAVSQQAQTSLRSIIGQSEMDQLLAERDSVNRELRRIIDEPTEGPWGIRVERVEIKDVSLPDSMKRSMSRQAEAERERRARIITADGEYQASKRLAMAANVMARDPAALQLRLLQTVVEVAGEQNSTLVMPVPVELLRFFEKMTPAGQGAELSPSLADFGDAEAAQAEAAIEGRPSEAGPDAVPPVEPIAIPPVEAIAIPPVEAIAIPPVERSPYRRWRRSPYRRWKHRTSRFPRSPWMLSKPNGRRRRLPGSRRTCTARPGIQFRVDAPQARGRSARTAPLLRRRLPLRCRNRRASPSPSVCGSSARPAACQPEGLGEFSAGSDSPVSTGSSHSRPALPPRATGGVGIAVADRDCQRPGGDHRASLIVCWQRRETPQAMAGTWPHGALMVTGR